MIRLGKQRYALDITCQARVLPWEPEPASGLIKTKFRRLRKPVAIGEGSREGILHRYGEPQSVCDLIKMT